MPSGSAHEPSAFFINIGRGKTTRLHDLVAASAPGKIAVRGWMYSRKSRFPRTHLWDAPNVLLTPAHAGFAYLEIGRRRSSSTTRADS